MTNLEELRLKKDFEVDLLKGGTVEDPLSEVGLNWLKESNSMATSPAMMLKNKEAVCSLDEGQVTETGAKIMLLSSEG